MVYAEIGKLFGIIVYSIVLFIITVNNDDMEISAGCMSLGFLSAILFGLLNSWLVILSIATFIAGIASGLVYHYTSNTLFGHFEDLLYEIRKQR